jgi:hypothetical protein
MLNEKKKNSKKKQYPDECLRDLEFIANLYLNSKLNQAKKQSWEVDLIREIDAKRMVLLARLAHQYRSPLPPPPPELISKSSNSGPGAMSRKKERDSNQMSRVRIELFVFEFLLSFLLSVLSCYKDFLLLTRSYFYFCIVCMCVFSFKNQRWR